MFYLKSAKKENDLKNVTDSTYSSFEELFLRALDYHVPKKEKNYKQMKTFW